MTPDEPAGPLALAPTETAAEASSGGRLEEWSRRTAALLVAAVAAYASYQHQRACAVHGGAHPMSASLWPLSVDGLLLLASIGLLRSGSTSSESVPAAESRPEPNWTIVRLEPHWPATPRWRVSSAKQIRIECFHPKIGHVAHCRPTALTSSASHSAVLLHAAAAGRCPRSCREVLTSRSLW